MAVSDTWIVFGLLTIVTVAMIIAALFQLSFLQKIEDYYGTELPLPRRFQTHGTEAEILRFGYIKPEVISWAPRIIVLHNFLSMEECDFLRAIALPHLNVSTVLDETTGEGIKSYMRTSSGMSLSTQMRKFRTIQAIEKRISVFSQVPLENGEPIQVLRYEKDQYYLPHLDYYPDIILKDPNQLEQNRGGQRIATMLMYLSDNVQGGETYFPMAGSGKCSCGGHIFKGLSVKPIKGDAVLFWSMGLDGQSDPKTIHGGCEVLAGEKWSATKWLRERTMT